MRVQIRGNCNYSTPCTTSAALLGYEQRQSAGANLNPTLPKRLKVDAILEATFELRFDSEASAVPEILFGQLVSTPAWAGYRPARLPTADIPISVRKSEQNLMHAPSIELTSNDGAVKVRFGPYSIVYSRVGKYPGWDPTFRDEIRATVERIFELLPDIEIKRIGLRYVNALRSDLHEIRNYDDVDLSVRLSNEVINTGLNVNYKLRENDNLEIICRVASAELAQGIVPENATIIVDLDVYTPDGHLPLDATAISEWVEAAHDIEKKNFFKILGDDATQRLREDA
ncbi:TIGR04255 family protein [Bosea sp. LjRoot237]|uniref:TIGR04255 family protein n=1 Tax=Bosea sp. LjRoot237 TaxID=3342292 RepID=UPI003ECCDE95